jgi:hypothetical protein
MIFSSRLIPKVSPVVSGPSATRVPAQPSGFLDRIFDIQFSKNQFEVPLTGMYVLTWDYRIQSDFCSVESGKK